MKRRNNLKLIRLKKGMRVIDLAEKLDVSERYIYFIEAGEKTPSLNLAQKISEVLDVNINTIF